MSGRRPSQAAAHVRAAIERGLGGAPVGAAQGRVDQPSSQPAAHVRAAVERGLGGSPAGHGGDAAQMRTLGPVPPHVRSAVDAGRGGEVQARAARLFAARGAIQARPDSFVTYIDVKSPTSPPPPPRWPVYSVSCAESGECTLRDLKTGRTRPAGDLYAGFVRVSAGGPVYVSPRPDVGLQGDSHPSIASVTPEERSGRGAIVAAGEVGFIDSRIVGHNDKTGHYRTRRNYWQSGMPPEKFHSFTEDPHDWYRPGAKSRKTPAHLEAATRKE